MFLVNILHVHVITCKLLFNCSKISSTVRFTFDHIDRNCLLISILFSKIRPSQQDICLNGWELYASFFQDVFCCGLLVKVDQTASMTDRKTSTMSPVIEANISSKSSSPNSQLLSPISHKCLQANLLSLRHVIVVSSNSHKPIHCFATPTTF
jgi:hypothetical protein